MMRSFAALPALLPAALAACVAFPSYPIRDERETTKVEKHVGGNVKLVVPIFRDLNDRPRPVPAQQQQEWRSAVVQAYAEVGVFDRMNGDEDPRFLVDVEVRDRGRVTGPLLTLTAVTLFLLPGTSSSEFVVTTQIRRPGEQVLIGQSQVRYSYRSYYHLLLLPFQVSNNERAVETEVIFGLARKGLAEAVRDAAKRDPSF
jgi:hypothetical protein